MKKRILCISVLLSFAIMPVGFAQEGEYRGDTQTRTETILCPSGIKRKCEGFGTYCEKTIGWDCEIVQE